MSTGLSSNIIIRLQNLPIEARALDIVSVELFLLFSIIKRELTSLMK